MAVLYTLIGLGACLALVGRLILQHLARRRLVQQFSCADPPTLPNAFPYTGAAFAKSYEEVRRTSAWLPFIRGLLSNPGRTTVAKIWGETWLFTSNADNIQAICTSAPVSVEKLRKPAGSEWIGDGMFISDGDRWKFSRTLFKPMFSRMSMSLPELSLETHFQNLLAQMPKNNETFDLQAMFKRLYLDIASETLLGESFYSQLGSEHIDFAAFEASFAYAMKSMSRKLSFGVKGAHDPMLNEHIKSVHRLFDTQIERRLKIKSASTGSMLHELANHSTDPKFLRDQLMNVFLGAKDTGALGLSFLFFHLVRHPVVVTKLRVEIGQLAANEQLTFERLKSLKYVQATIAESLRLLSPVTRSLRTTTKDCVLPAGGGESGQQPIFVPRATRIEISMSNLHVDEQIWGPRAEEFWPERWEQLKSHPKWEYVPFLGGSRICPAQQMILTQYAYILVRFLQSIGGIENRDPELEFKPNVVFSQESANGVLVAVTA